MLIVASSGLQSSFEPIKPKLNIHLVNQTRQEKTKKCVSKLCETTTLLVLIK